jgi:hypothetical protein
MHKNFSVKSIHGKCQGITDTIATVARLRSLLIDFCPAQIQYLSPLQKLPQRLLFINDLIPLSDLVKNSTTKDYIQSPRKNVPSQRLQRLKTNLILFDPKEPQ